MDHTLLCYWLEILCLCADNPSTRVHYLQSGIVELAQQLTVCTCDVILRLITKSLVGHVTTETSDKLDGIVPITDEEMDWLNATLQASSSPLLMDHTMASVLKGLMSTDVNTEKFHQHKLIPLLKQKWSTSTMDHIIAQLEGSSVTDVSTQQQPTDDEQVTACCTSMLLGDKNAGLLFYISLFIQKPVLMMWSQV